MTGLGVGALRIRGCLKAENAGVVPDQSTNTYHGVDFKQRM